MIARNRTLIQLLQNQNKILKQSLYQDIGCWRPPNKSQEPLLQPKKRTPIMQKHIFHQKNEYLPSKITDLSLLLDYGRNSPGDFHATPGESPGVLPETTVEILPESSRRPKKLTPPCKITDIVYGRKSEYSTVESLPEISTELPETPWKPPGDLWRAPGDLPKTF